MKKCKEPKAEKLMKVEKEEGKVLKKLGKKHEALDHKKKPGKKHKKKK